MVLPKNEGGTNMGLHFNVKGESRKAMVKAIEQELGVKARYLGVPSCSYEIGIYTVGKNGELEFAEVESREETAKVIDACVLATGISPAEWENNMDEPEREPQSENVGVTVAIPINNVKVDNLTALIDSKAGLIKKALGIHDLSIKVDEEKVSFPWFSEGLDAEIIQTYTRFISSLCEMSVNQKRIQAKEKQVDNEKYAFRCFLLRLGFIGAEYKADRKILLKNLEGSSAFKNGAKGGEE
jgi:hypothetical protein